MNLSSMNTRLLGGTPWRGTAFVFLYILHFYFKTAQFSFFKDISIILFILYMSL